MEISKKLKKSIPRSPFCRPSHFWRTHIVLVLPYHFWLLVFYYSFLTMYLLFTGRKWLLIARGMDLSPHISFGRKISSGWTSSKLNKVINQSYFDLKLFHVQPTVQNIIRLSDIFTFVQVFFPYSHFSIMYLVISSPPSSVGGFHSSSTESEVMSFSTIGPIGLLGLSAELIWNDQETWKISCIFGINGKLTPKRNIRIIG